MDITLIVLEVSIKILFKLINRILGPRVVVNCLCLDYYYDPMESNVILSEQFLKLWCDVILIALQIVDECSVIRTTNNNSVRRHTDQVSK